MYLQTSNIRCTLLGCKIVDHSDVVGASPVGAAPTASSFSTEHLASMDWADKTARRDENHISFGIWCALYKRFYGMLHNTNDVTLWVNSSQHGCCSWLGARTSTTIMMMKTGEHMSGLPKSTAGMILGMGSANERRCYIVTPSLIGWAHTQNGPCNACPSLANSSCGDCFLVYIIIIIYYIYIYLIYIYKALENLVQACFAP